jgi:hypothetical protein
MSDETDPSSEDVNPLTDLTDDEGEQIGPEDILDPEEGTAAGGTARADALFGADEVDEALGDDAPARPERGDEPGSQTAAPGLSDDEAEEAEDDEDFVHEDLKALAESRAEWLEEAIERNAAIKSAYGRGQPVVPAEDEDDPDATSTFPPGTVSEDD